MVSGLVGFRFARGVQCSLSDCNYEVIISVLQFRLFVIRVPFRIIRKFSMPT